MNAPQRHTHHLNFPIADSQALRVANAILLPLRAGYTPGHLASDVLAVFESVPRRRRLKDVVRAWQDAAAYTVPSQLSPLSARQKCVAFARFFSLFSHSQLRADFLSRAQDDPVRAAQAFLDWVAAEAQAGGGGQAGQRDTGAMLNALLHRFRRGLDIPFAPPSDDAGSAHSRLMQRALRVAELLPRVRRQYQFAAVRGVRREVVSYPDDDFDLRPLRDWTELARLPLRELMLSDEEFYARAVKRELLTYEHQRVIPEPRAFVMLLDVSGSMDGQAGGTAYTRSEWAIAVALALLEQAQRGHNRVTLLRFDAEAFAPIRGSARQIADAVWRCEFSGGGTSFEAAFRAADDAEPAADAVVLVTDGEADFSRPPRAPLFTLQTHPQLKDTLRAASRRYEVVL